MAIRTWTLVSALVTTLAASATAFAQSAPPADPGAGQAASYDEVTLKNGGMLRGTVVSMEPEKEVAIVVQGTTAARHVPWAEVDQVTRGKTAPFPGVTIPPPPPAPPPFALSPTGSVLTYPPAPAVAPPVPGELGAPRLHIDSSTPVTLHETLETDLGRIRPIDCQSPCDKVIDGRSGQVFFFAGDEIPQSSRFHVTEKSGDVTVRVSPGSFGVRKAGGVLIGLGITAAVAGSVLLPIGMAVNAGNADSAAQMHSPASSSPLIPAGAATLGVGGAMLVTGIVMNVLGHTRYDFSTAAVPGGFRF
jgi:hypothetical protein